jgi:hypothetical protein
MFAFFGVGVAEIVISFRVLGIDLHRFGVIGDGFVQFI